MYRLIIPNNVINIFKGMGSKSKIAPIGKYVINTVVNPIPTIESNKSGAGLLLMNGFLVRIINKTINSVIMESINQLL